MQKKIFIKKLENDKFFGAMFALVIRRFYHRPKNLRYDCNDRQVALKSFWSKVSLRHLENNPLQGLQVHVNFIHLVQSNFG